MNFKDYFDESLKDELGKQFTLVCKNFDSHAFKIQIGKLTALEMKSRIFQFSKAINQGLTSYSYEKQLEMIQKIFFRLAQTKENFIFWIVLDFIERYGVDHFEISITAMYKLTEIFSAEFAMRPFLKKYPDKTLKILHQWVIDPNPHIRRLASECTRTRLPWATHLTQFINDPQPIFDLLAHLINEKHEYVRKSLANNLNDLSKDHPELMLNWLKQGKDKTVDAKNFNWIIRHSCRSLIKKGNQKAFTLQGFKTDLNIEVLLFNIDKTEIAIGEALCFNVKIKSLSKKDQNLLIDLNITFQTQKGTSQRTLKWTRKSVASNQIISLKKELRLLNNSIKNYYPGEHEVNLIINGKIYAKALFFIK